MRHDQVLMIKGRNDRLKHGVKRLTLLSVAENAQNEEEQVQDVQVQVDAGNDVLVSAELVHHHLRVHDNEQAARAENS